MTRVVVQRSRADHTAASPFTIATALFAVLLAAVPHAAKAQAFPGFGGLEVRLGTASPQNADLGVGLAADLDLGGLGIGTLRLLAGLHRFGVDLDRNDAEGDYTATGARLALRLDPLARQRFSPFVGAALTAHSVSAQADNAGVEDLIEGFYVGGSLLGGAAYDLDMEGRYAAVLEVRRTFASNIEHTAVELGIRWLPRARGSYDISP